LKPACIGRNGKGSLLRLPFLLEIEDRIVALQVRPTNQLTVIPEGLIGNPV
jgi:hypothetical protein